MEPITTLLTRTIELLRTAIFGQIARKPAPELRLAETRLARIAKRFNALFARFLAGTLPSQTGAAPRPSRAGQASGGKAPRQDLPRASGWLLRTPEELRLVAAATRSHVQHILRRPDLAEFLAAAPQAGRLLRPLCRMLMIHASPDAPAALALPKAPRVRGIPPAPIHLGIIDPPEGRPLHLSWARSRAGRAPYL